MSDLIAQLRAGLAGRYAIDREIGRGGMASVFLATDLRQDRPVAIKVLHPEFALAVGGERFLREVRLTARLQHPHILPVFDSGEAGGHLWYAMPFVDGESLRERLARDGTLPVDEALGITQDVARALDYAHSHGVVHRDVKPENVMLTGGQAVLADFGIARLTDAPGERRITESGISVGTLAYMSPEQTLGESVDGRSDVYALGCVLYEMLAGQPPFAGPTPQAVLARRLQGDVPPVRVVRDTVSAGLDAALARALSRSSVDRFATAGQFAAAALAGRTALSPSHGPPSTAGTHGPSWWQRAPVRAGAVVAVATLAVLAGVLFRDRRHSPPTAASPIRLAVLYLENLSADTLDRYLADGLTEEIISRLAGVDRLSVKSRNAVRRFRDSTDMAGVAASLGVRYLVEGSVRRSGERVRVATNLLDAATGNLVWRQQYDRTAMDLLEVQEEIASEVVKAIAGELAPSERASIRRRTTEVPEAYDQYLRGNYRLAQRTPRATTQALRHYREAVRLDPAYADSYAATAYASAIALDWGWEIEGGPPDSVLTRGLAAADRALRQDSTSSLAWMARGYLLSFHDPLRLTGAREAFERAVVLDPKNAEAFHQFGWILLELGEDSAAITAFHRALAVEPERPITLEHLARTNIVMRRYGEAERWLDSSLRVDPQFALGYAMRSLLRSAQGQPARALPDARQAASLNPGGTPVEAALAIAEAGAGHSDSARSRAGRLERDASATEPVPVAGAWLGAMALVATGERERALKLLSRAQPRGGHLLFDLRWPFFDSIREEPRFKTLVAESGPGR